MTTTAQPLTGHLRHAREVRPGWWLHFSGRVDPDTFEVTPGPYWVQVAGVEELGPDPWDRRYRSRRLLYTDDTYADFSAMTDVHALTAQQAQEAGLTKEDGA